MLERKMSLRWARHRDRTLEIFYEVFKQLRFLRSWRPLLKVAIVGKISFCSNHKHNRALLREIEERKATA